MVDDSPMNMHTAYQIATCDHLPPPHKGWGHASEDELRALQDAARAYDATGSVMPEGGLTRAEEWALEFAGWGQ